MNRQKLMNTSGNDVYVVVNECNGCTLKSVKKKRAEES